MELFGPEPTVAEPDVVTVVNLVGYRPCLSFVSRRVIDQRLPENKDGTRGCSEQQQLSAYQLRYLSVRSATVALETAAGRRKL